MSWTEKEVGAFQSVNNKMLAEINATLRPDENLKGKVGVFLHGQLGDLATAMSVLKYRREIFGDKEIIWFANYPNADLLRYAPISEVRPWVWAGNGLPEGTPDFYPLLCNENNRLDLVKSKEYELTADLDDGYFPAPHMMSMENRRGIDYPNVSRKIFGVSSDKEWHPYLSWSFDEQRAAEILLQIRKTDDRHIIMLETFCGSGQSRWDDLMTVKTIEMCREKWGASYFLFASHKNTEQFKDFEGYISCAHLTPRQTALLINYCDLFVGISSGISVVTSAWGLKPVPKIQYCGSFTCSTVTLSACEINLITSDDKDLDASKSEFYDKLKEVISRIK